MEEIQDVIREAQTESCIFSSTVAWGNTVFRWQFTMTTWDYEVLTLYYHQNSSKQQLVFLAQLPCFIHLYVSQCETLTCRSMTSIGSTFAFTLMCVVLVCYCLATVVLKFPWAATSQTGFFGNLFLSNHSICYFHAGLTSTGMWIFSHFYWIAYTYSEYDISAVILTQHWDFTLILTVTLWVIIQVKHRKSGVNII